MLDWMGWSYFSRKSTVRVLIIIKKNREALIKGVKRVKESVIKQMENSDSKAEI